MAKSIRSQITEVQVKIDALLVIKAGLEGKLETEVDTDAAQEGVEVLFVYGKGEGKKTLQGTIVGRKDADGTPSAKQTFLKVAVGSGFDTDVKTIALGQITAIVPVAQEPEAPATEESQASA